MILIRAHTPGGAFPVTGDAIVESYRLLPSLPLEGRAGEGVVGAFALELADPLPQSLPSRGREAKEPFLQKAKVNTPPQGGGIKGGGDHTHGTLSS